MEICEESPFGVLNELFNPILDPEPFELDCYQLVASHGWFTLKYVSK